MLTGTTRARPVRRERGLRARGAEARDPAGGEAHAMVLVPGDQHRREPGPVAQAEESCRGAEAVVARVRRARRRGLEGEGPRRTRGRLVVRWSAADVAGASSVTKQRVVTVGRPKVKR